MKSTKKGISNDRARHMFATAKLMQETALSLGWGEEKANEMFVLGLVHDAGYAFTDVQKEHAKAGADVMARLGFKYSDRIANHGFAIQHSETDDELNLLNLCDALVDSDGTISSPGLRLYNIGKRYGNDSDQYKAAKATLDATIAWANKKGIKIGIY
jgi:hypothetical protein